MTALSVARHRVALRGPRVVGVGSHAARRSRSLVAVSVRAPALAPGLTPGLAGLVGGVCPVAPPGAQAHADTLLGYVLWGVLSLFLLGVIVGVGSMVAGRIFGMPHASRAGVVSLVMVFLSAIAYLVLPAMVKTMTGTGCLA